MNKRVLMLIPTLYLTGGAQDQLKLLSKHLISINVPLDIKSIFEKPNQTLSTSKVPFFSYFSRTQLFVEIASVAKVIKFSFLYKIIHLHGLGLSFYILGFMSIILKTRLIVKIPRTGDGSFIDNAHRNFFRHVTFKLAALGVYKFIALTPDARSSLLKLGIKSCRIEIIPNGVEVLKEKVKRKKDGVLKICFAGRLIARKQVDIVIQSASIMKSKGLIDFHVYIIGDGPEKQNLVDMTMSLGLNKYVSFTGKLENGRVLEYLNKMNALVLPSLSEGMSNSLLQGCSSGCVPLVWDIPQNKNIVEQAKNGFIFSSAQELAKYLIRIADSSFAEKISDAAHQNACSNYDIKKIALSYKFLYEK
jgi:glycosyltransferase involved in cell wall biosynthesis